MKDESIAEQTSNLLVGADFHTSLSETMQCISIAYISSWQNTYINFQSMRDEQRCFIRIATS
jgi:hypothetical protein